MNDFVMELMSVKAALEEEQIKNNSIKLECEEIKAEFAKVRTGLFAARIGLAKLDAQLALSEVGLKKAVLKPPGYSLAKFAEFLYSKKAYQEVFQPILSDLDLEYQEALAAKRWHKARWVVLRGRGHFLAAALARVPVSLTRLVVTLWKLGGS